VDVLDVADAPHATDEQLLVGVDGGRDEHLLMPRLASSDRLVDIVLLVEVDVTLSMTR
jgi:hypothetical protein